MKKRKFIGNLMALLLIVALLAFALPAMSPDVDVGAASGSSSVGAADLAAMNSGAAVLAMSPDVDVGAASGTVTAAVVITNSSVTPAPATPSAPASKVWGMTIWLVLGASLVTLAVAHIRRRYKTINLKTIGLCITSDDPVSAMGGGPNKCILLVAA